MDALELAVAGERVKVAADGHLGDVEARGEVGDVGGPTADGLQDLLPALCGKQGHGLFEAVRNEQTCISFEAASFLETQVDLGARRARVPPLPDDVRKHVPSLKRPCQLAGSVTVTRDV